MMNKTDRVHALMELNFYWGLFLKQITSVIINQGWICLSEDTCLKIRDCHSWEEEMLLASYLVGEARDATNLLQSTGRSS